MAGVRNVAQGHPRLRPLIEYALREGWTVERTAGGHLKFIKPGLPPIYTSSTASDYRVHRNACARLRRAGRQVEPSGTGGRSDD